MFFRLVDQYAKRGWVSEQLKADAPVASVQKMNNICNRVTEVVNAEVVLIEEKIY